VSAIAKEDLEEASVSSSDASNYVRSGVNDGYLSSTRQRTAAYSSLSRSMALSADDGGGQQSYLGWAWALVTGEPSGSATEISVKTNGDFFVVTQTDSKEGRKGAESSEKNVVTGGEDLGEECDPLLQVQDKVTVGFRKGGDKRDEIIDLETGYDGISGSPLLKSLYYVVQGVLAGFSFVSLYGREAARSDMAFLAAYQTISADHRRFFYILTSAALVGSLDTAMGVVSQISPHKDRAAAGRRLALTMIPVVAVTVFMHILCFLVNLSMSRFDTLVAHKNGYMNDADDDNVVVVSTSWIEEALDDQHFMEQFMSWKTLERFRLTSALVSWVGCCVLIWFQFQIVPSMSSLQRATKRHLDMWRTQARELQGAPGSFDKYTSHADPSAAMSALRRLMDMQHEGLDKAQNALRTLEKATER